MRYIKQSYIRQTGKLVGSTGKVLNIADVLTPASEVNHGVALLEVTTEAYQLPNLPCRQIIISAKASNTGTVKVGNEFVTSADYGIELAAGDSLSLSVSNANLICLLATTAGDGVTFLAT